MTYADRMREIEKSDRGRRFLREYDAEVVGIKTTSDSYLVSRGITGEPSNHNRVVRASESSWDTTLKGKKAQPVKVTLNGQSTWVPQGSFRHAGSRASREAIEVRETAQDRRMRLLASAGNNSDVD